MYHAGMSSHRSRGISGAPRSALRSNAPLVLIGISRIGTGGAFSRRGFFDGGGAADSEAAATVAAFPRLGSIAGPQIS